MKPVNAPYQLSLAKSSHQYSHLQQFIQDQYLHEFNATIPHFLPVLLGLYRADGQLVSACGLNPAHLNNLYLEHYLDAPIEQVVANQHGIDMDRSQIIEIGNFAAVEAGSSRIMFAALCLLLRKSHLDYVAFTGTNKIRNIFQRLHINPVELSPALPERLGEDANAWGEYYRNHPLVMIGDVNAGYQTLCENSLLFSLFGAVPSLFSETVRTSA